MGGALLCFLPFAIQTIIFGDDENKRILVFDVIFMFGTFGFLFSALGNSLIKINKFEYIQGEFKGELEFGYDEIIMADKAINLDEISKINLTAFDYKGWWTYASFRANIGDAYKSNGTGNILEVILKNGEIIKINFEQQFDGEIRNDINALINYCNNGKLYYITIIDILGLTDYKEIQEFKKMHLKQFQ